MTGNDAIHAVDFVAARGAMVPDVPQTPVTVVPTADIVVFPASVASLTISDPGTIRAVRAAQADNQPIAVVLQREAERDSPTPGGLYSIGCLCDVLRLFPRPDGQLDLICRGVRRVRLDPAEVAELIESASDYSELRAHLQPAGNHPANLTCSEARFLQLRENTAQLLEMLPQAPWGLAASVRDITDPGELSDLAVSFIELSPVEAQTMLETLDVDARIRHVGHLVQRRFDAIRVADEIDARARKALDERHREMILREQLAAILRELGEEVDGKSADVSRLAEVLGALGMPKPVETRVWQELKRYERLPEGANEAGMLRTWLDWVAEMPWQTPPDAPIDLAQARHILDSEHFGLEKIKTRIIQFLAVRKLAPTSRTPILCFVGPPGVGKTSLGHSIAKAMARPFARVSLGGVHSEAEIRGHRRTYVGALPGAIMQAIHRAGAPNCVVMLDEIDKLVQGREGDPAAALLDVLGTTQNSAFRDNYFGIDYDLSQVIFLTTANMREGIPRSLSDRLDFITLPGYTGEEKFQIARRHLLPRQLAASGVQPGQLELSDSALFRIIRDYAREAGARELDRQIGAVLRHVAVEIAEGTQERVNIDAEDLPGILGAPRFENEVALSASMPGVATGLAWTPAGGEIIFVEASQVPGHGALVLTGQLGDVMRESAQAALTLLKARAPSLGLEASLFTGIDVHVHVPAGAAPKDGPSAGVAIFAALASLLTDRKLRSDTAMTGELSLRGVILPVGGVREKVVAAASGGIKRVLLPARNQKDFDDIPDSARKRLQFVWLTAVEDVLMAALEAPQ